MTMSPSVHSLALTAAARKRPRNTTDRFMLASKLHCSH